MANIDKLVPGQVVYSVQRVKMGNTTMSRNACYEVRIVSVNIEEGWVEASWNSNPPKRYPARYVEKWRVKKPIPKSDVFGLPSY